MLSRKRRGRSAVLREPPQPQNLVWPAGQGQRTVDGEGGAPDAGVAAQASDLFPLLDVPGTQKVFLRLVLSGYRVDSSAINRKCDKKDGVLMSRKGPQRL